MASKAYEASSFIYLAHWSCIVFIFLLFSIVFLHVKTFSVVAKVSSYGDFDLDECVSKHMGFMFLNIASSCWDFDLSVCLHEVFVSSKKLIFSGILIWVNLQTFGVSILGKSFVLLGILI
jgi:hypothetical protein